MPTEEDLITQNSHRPAFAVSKDEDDDIEGFFIGLSKREYMATHIMTGLCAVDEMPSTAERVAEDAVYLADALLAQLEK